MSQTHLPGGSTTDIRLGVNLLPRFLDGERIAARKKWVWLASGKSFPTYRLGLTIPPLVEAGLYVTDRRVLLIAHVLRLLVMEQSFWFRSTAPSEASEVITESSIERVPVLGRCLQIITEDPKRHWYRGHRLRLRFYMSDPQHLQELISSAIGPGDEGLGQV